MPSFTLHSPTIGSRGLISTVSLQVCAAAEEFMKRDGALPPPIVTTAKLDTGADRSVICHGIVEKLGLLPVGLSFVDTPSSQNIPCYEYAVRVVFPNEVVWQGSMLEYPTANGKVNGNGNGNGGGFILIGRDILSHGVLTYIGYDNSFSLSF